MKPITDSRVRADRPARPDRRVASASLGPRLEQLTIVFAVILLEESQLPHEQTILWAIYLTVGLSVLLHGITAAPLADRYGRWYDAAARTGRPSMEAVPANVTRPRRAIGEAPERGR